MATYYIPPPQRAVPLAQEPSTTIRPSANPDEVLASLDLHPSVYVFPNPSSSPGSPGSSLFSLSTDFSGPFPETSSSRSRGRDHSTSVSSSRVRDPSGGSTPNDASPQRVARQPPASGRSSNVDVEVWNWMASSSEDVNASEEWELEAEVERLSRWEVASHPRRAWPIHAGLPESVARNGVVIPLRLVPQYEDQYHSYSRSRTQSSLSSGSLGTTLSSRLSTKDTPQPRIRIPLLSFVASLFSLDLDDPALRLLESSSSECVLFPGQSDLLSSHDTQSTQDSSSSQSSGDGSCVTESPHGLLRLLIMGDGSRVSLRSLKEGLSIVCNPSFSVPQPFTIPNLRGFFGFYHLVGDALSKGGRAWSELRTTETFA